MFCKPVSEFGEDKDLELSTKPEEIQDSEAKKIMEMLKYKSPADEKLETMLSEIDPELEELPISRPGVEKATIWFKFAIKSTEYIDESLDTDKNANNNQLDLQEIEKQVARFQFDYSGTKNKREVGRDYLGLAESEMLNKNY